MNKVKSVAIVGQVDWYWTEVGKNGVEKIIDNTANGMGFCVMGENDKLIKRIIDCPVEVTYF